MTVAQDSILQLLIRLGSVAFLLVFWVCAILWCAVRYTKAPGRYAGMAGLFTAMLSFQLVWPLARMSVGRFIMGFGIPMDLTAVGLGSVDSFLMFGVPAMTLAVIALQTQAPQPS